MDEALVVVDHLFKSFTKKEVLHDIQFHVNAGEIFGLLGPSGSGKTTLVKLVMGMETADKGKITVLGTTVPNLQVVQSIGYMAQSDALYEDLTAKENLHFFASMYGLKGKRMKERVAYVLELVELSEDGNKRIVDFSGGMKRRLSLAISLLHEPGVLIFDEPTVGIDPILRQSIWNEFEMLRQKGTALIVTTHVMDEAEKCGRLGMIRGGNLIAVGSPNELMRQAGADTMEKAFLYFGRDRT